MKNDYQLSKTHRKTSGEKEHDGSVSKTTPYVFLYFFYPLQVLDLWIYIEY